MTGARPYVGVTEEDVQPHACCPLCPTDMTVLCASREGLTAQARVEDECRPPGGAQTYCGESQTERSSVLRAGSAVTQTGQRTCVHALSPHSPFHPPKGGKKRETLN